MNFFDPATGFYYYAALFQGNLALLGILAVLVTFKIQSIENTIANLYDIAAENVRDAFLTKTGSPVPIETTTTEEIRESLDKIADSSPQTQITDGYDAKTAIKAADEIRHDHYLQTTLRQIEFHEVRRSAIIKRLILPAASIFVVVLVSLVSLPLTSLIHGVSNLELCSFVTLTVLQIVALMLSAFYVYWVLNE